jgi:drug/metabolite transporter (DMT)-like permease
MFVSKFWVWFLFVLLTFLWGCSYFFMKAGMEVYSPLQMAGMRIAFAGIAMMPWSLWHLTKVPKNKIGLLMLSGFLGNGIPAILFCLALKGLDTNLGGILNALTPLWVLLIGVLFFKKKSNTQKTLGVLCGFAGILLLFISKGNINLHNVELSLYIVLATMMYAININIVDTYLKDVSSLHIGTVSTLGIGICYIALLSIGIDNNFGHAAFSIIQWDERHVWFAVALGVLNTALSNVLFYQLVKISGPSFASMVTYVMPFVTIFVALIIGETIATQSLFCLSFILFGVYLVKRAK